MNSPGTLILWLFNGEAIQGAYGDSYTIDRVEPGHAGSYTAVATDLGGTFISNPAVLSVIRAAAVGGGFENGRAEMGSARAEEWSVRPEKQSVRSERQSVRSERQSVRSERQSVRPEIKSVLAEIGSVRLEKRSVNGERGSVRFEIKRGSSHTSAPGNACKWRFREMSCFPRRSFR